MWRAQEERLSAEEKEGAERGLGKVSCRVGCSPVGWMNEVEKI